MRLADELFQRAGTHPVGQGRCLSGRRRFAGEEFLVHNQFDVRGSMFDVEPWTLNGEPALPAGSA
jgi:hypothetical protein